MLGTKRRAGRTRRRRGPPWFVEDQETRVPHIDKACEEVSLRSSNEHAGRAGLQLDGLVAKQEKILFVRRKCEQQTLLEGTLD